MLEVKEPEQVVNGILVLVATCEKCKNTWETTRNDKRCPKCNSEDWHTNIL